MASPNSIYDPASEQQLMTALWDPRISDDLYNFIMFVYPWGKPGTPLETRKGPRKWQKKILDELTGYLKLAKDRQMAFEELVPMFKKAVASGRGIGKSALFAWIAHWMVSTRIGSSVWVMANGEPQLKTKTFPEIAKWVNLSMNSHWFEPMATAILPAKWLSELVSRDLKIDPKYWYISAQLWSEENPDAAAGAHNAYGEMALLDEASGIPANIWTVVRGVFTEPTFNRFMLAFSNPRRNDGAFFECFYGPEREDWRGEQINSLDVEDIPKDELLALVKKHGEDSDEARMEVRGQFPNRSERQFIPTSLPEEAAKRPIFPDPGAPLLLGVDVARGDRDSNVLAFRQGRDARTIPWLRFTSTDTTKVASIVAEQATRYKVDAIFVDGNGVGGGVVDLLKSWKFRIIEVQAGAAAIEDHKYLNRRAETWARMKDWLGIGSTPDDPILKSDLRAPEYDYDTRTNRLVLESKEHMRDKRRIASPDMADALAMTFAQTIARNDTRVSRTWTGGSKVARDVDYPMFS